MRLLSRCCADSALRARSEVCVSCTYKFKLKKARAFHHVPDPRGPRAGQKLFTLQTVPPRLRGLDGDPSGAARAGGSHLHAGVDIAPNQREMLERLCRYVSRPPVASERLALSASGHVRYTLKTPYRDGTTHVVLEPLYLMARLAGAGAAVARAPDEIPRRVCSTRFGCGRR
jgi:hypothetical protein